MQQKNPIVKIPTFKLKSQNEDFEVTEIPLLPTISSKGSHTYLWIKKSGYSTFDAQDQLKNYFKLSDTDINVEGLKDEDGVTSQIFSVRRFLTTKEVLGFNRKLNLLEKYIKIERIMGYGKTPVAEKMLHGNSFNLVVRNLGKNAVEGLERFCRENKYVSFINYYDTQRFGLPGGPYNAHLIGKALVEKDWKEAYKQYKISGNKGLPENFLPNSSTSSAAYRKIFLEVNLKKLSFFISSYDSYIWNEEVSKVLQKTCKGTFCSFKEAGNLFVPEGNAFTLPNIFSCKGHGIKPDLTTYEKPNSRCTTITTTVYTHTLEKDERNEGKKRITLSFFLPLGCYATMLVRQLVCKSI